MKRKSPYRHKVREHKRQDIPISSYMRGNGPKGTLRHKVVKGSFQKFNVTAYYPGEVRDLELKGADWQEALAKIPRLSETTEVHMRVV